MFREKDIIQRFQEYSNGKPQEIEATYKLEASPSMSGKNLLQDAVKNLAKGRLNDMKIEQERFKRVGVQETETKLLIDYYNNKKVSKK